MHRDQLDRALNERNLNWTKFQYLALFAVIQGECLKSETARRSGMNIRTLITDCPVSKIGCSIRRLSVRCRLRDVDDSQDGVLKTRKMERSGPQALRRPQQSTQLSSLASERAGLFLTARRGSFDQSRGLACVSLVLEAEQRRVSSIHHVRHHEAHVDPRIADRFRDRVAETRPIVALD